MSTRHRSITGFAAVVLTFVTVGCSMDAAEQPTSPAAPSCALAAPSIRDGGKWIGPAGGFVESGGVRLDVPAGALETGTLLAIHRQADGSVDLTPDGQQFDIPVRLHLAAPAGSAPAACSIQWYDPARSLWVAIPSNSESIGRVAPLAHFSVYRIINLTE